MAEIKRQRAKVDTKLVKGGGGQFDVALDGKLIFSKKQAGRFPNPQEILDQIPAA